MEGGGPATDRSAAQSLLRITRGPREISPQAQISWGFQKRKWRRRMALITSSSPRAEPPGKRWKNVSTASPALSNLMTASQPLKSPFSASADHVPSLTVARHLPPQGPRTSMPYWKSCPLAVFSSTVYCQNTKAYGRISPAVASSIDASLSPNPYSTSYGSTPQSMIWNV